MTRNPSPNQPTKPAKPPIWKRVWAIPAAAGLVGLILGASIGGSDSTAGPTMSATVTVTATEAAEAAPTVTVTEAVPTVTVTEGAEAVAETSSPATPVAASEDPQTTGGLDEYAALQACANVAETGLKNDYPASKVKVHWIAGVLAKDLNVEDDSWFIKVEASVDKNSLNVECTVTGSEGSPRVSDVIWY